MYTSEIRYSLDKYNVVATMCWAKLNKRLEHFIIGWSRYTQERLHGTGIFFCKTAEQLREDPTLHLSWDGEEPVPVDQWLNDWVEAIWSNICSI